MATALIVTLPGEPEPDMHRPGTGCGRSNPARLNIIPAEVLEVVLCV